MIPIYPIIILRKPKVNFHLNVWFRWPTIVLKVYVFCFKQDQTSKYYILIVLATKYMKRFFLISINIHIQNFSFYYWLFQNFWLKITIIINTRGSRDKTMDDKMMYISNDDYLLCKIKLLVEKLWHWCSTLISPICWLTINCLCLQ